MRRVPHRSHVSSAVLESSESTASRVGYLHLHNRRLVTKAPGSVRTQRRGRIASFLVSRGDLLMSCPHCLSTSTSKRKNRTGLGYRTFFCPSCGKRFNGFYQNSALDPDFSIIAV